MFCSRQGLSFIFRAETEVGQSSYFLQEMVEVLVIAARSMAT